MRRFVQRKGVDIERETLVLLSWDMCCTELGRT